MNSIRKAREEAKKHAEEEEIKWCRLFEAKHEARMKLFDARTSLTYEVLSLIDEMKSLSNEAFREKLSSIQEKADGLLTLKEILDI